MQVGKPERGAGCTTVREERSEPLADEWPGSAGDAARAGRRLRRRELVNGEVKVDPAVHPQRMYTEVGDEGDRRHRKLPPLSEPADGERC